MHLGVNWVSVSSGGLSGGFYGREAYMPMSMVPGRASYTLVPGTGGSTVGVWASNLLIGAWER